MGILANPPADKYFAPRNSHHLASLFVELSGRSSHDAYVGHLDLSTAVGTARNCTVKFDAMISYNNGLE
jgi:hypothetical protein